MGQKRLSFWHPRCGSIIAISIHHRLVFGDSGRPLSDVGGVQLEGSEGTGLSSFRGYLRRIGAGCCRIGRIWFLIVRCPWLACESNRAMQNGPSVSLRDFSKQGR